MEIIATALEVFGRAVSAIAWSICLIYIVGIITKTVLIMNADADPEELKDWLNFGFFNGRKNGSGKL